MSSRKAKPGTLAAGTELYERRHPRARRPVEQAEPAGTTEAGAQAYRARTQGVRVEAVEHQPDNIGPEAA